MRAPELDICECGDYRRDHEGGTGRCIFRDHHILDPELNRCDRFRLAASPKLLEEQEEV
jgi:hypothetical protein